MTVAVKRKVHVEIHTHCGAPVNPVQPSLTKFSSGGANVEFLREIHAAKYVAARGGRGGAGARSGASTDKIKLLPAGLADKAKI